MTEYQPPWCEMVKSSIKRRDLHPLLRGDVGPAYQDGSQGGLRLRIVVFIGPRQCDDEPARYVMSQPVHVMNYATQPASGYGMAFRASSWPRLLSAHRKLTRAPFCRASARNRTCNDASVPKASFSRRRAICIPSLKTDRTL
jgi:hypothetical protein